MKDQLRQAKSKEPSESYSKFRVRWRHVLLIDQQVRAGQAPNCRRLAEELEVSRRTVLRDVDFMRYDLSAPIEYDPAKGGYVYTEPNWTMPSVLITEGELLALMVAEKALDAYAGTPWAAKLRQVFERMTAALPDRLEVPPRELLPRLEFDGSAASIVDPAVIQTIESALRGDQTLRIRYAPLGRLHPRPWWAGGLCHQFERARRCYPYSSVDGEYGGWPPPIPRMRFPVRVLPEREGGNFSGARKQGLWSGIANHG